jgi:osmotically-inducible protein OsmY
MNEHTNQSHSSDAQSSDPHLAAAIRVALRESQCVSAVPIEVRVAGGIVTLSGRVQSYRRKEEAEEIARARPGVLDVHNLLEVDAPPRPDRKELADETRRILDEDPEIKKNTISVAVHAGVVTLRGSVAGLDERRRAHDLMLAIPGVSQVRNLLVVDDNTHRHGLAATRELELALHFAPDVPAEDLHLGFSGGTLTLSGAASPQGRVAAEQIARRVLDPVRIHNEIRTDNGQMPLF